MKTLTSMICLVALLLATAACGAPKGRLKIAGSTTLLLLSQGWAEEFMAKNPSASVSVSGGGSGAGLSGLLNGTCEIANASREAKPKERDAARERNSKLVATKCAKDGLAIIVHASNNVKNLTIDQIKAIYSGRATLWSQVGGLSDKAIVAVGRDSSSGTYGFFQDAILGGGPHRKDMLGQSNNAAVAQAVSQSRDAIGYVGMAYAWEMVGRGKVKVLFVSRKKGETGQAPTEETVKSGSYPLFRYLYMYTLGSPKVLAKNFIAFCLSPEGQALVKKSGYLPAK